MQKIGQIVLFWAVLLYAVASASSAFAFDCDSVFADETGRVPADAAQAAADRLINSGADVRVRVITSAAQYGNLDLYKDQTMKSCRSWQSADGGMKNNLIVAVFSMDHKAGLYFGDQYRSALQGRTAGIRAEQMNPRFRDGDFSGGIAAGLDGARDLIVEAAKPPAPVAPVPPVIVQQAPSKPVDLSGLWIVMGWGLGLALLGFVVWMILNSKQNKAHARAAQQGAQAKRTACANRINVSPSPFVVLRARLAKIAKLVHDGDVASLQARAADLEGQSTALGGRFADLASSQNDPDRSGLSSAEYRRMEREFTEILAELNRIESDRNEIVQASESLERNIADAQTALQELNKLVDATAAVLVNVREQGFSLGDIEGLLAEAVAACDAALTAQNGKKFVAAIAHCSMGTKKAEQAKTAAEGLAARKQAIESHLALLERVLPATDTAIKDCAAQLAVLKTVYAASSLETVQSAATQARERYNSVKNALTKVRACVTAQQWSEAEKLVEAAKLLLQEAASYTRSVDALQSTLQEAKRDAQGEISAAQSDINISVAYNRQHDADVNDAVWDDLKTAQGLVDEAKVALGTSLPDYPSIVLCAKRANALADKTLAQAQGEHEAAERLRRRVSSGLRDANAAISLAKQYIEDHARTVAEQAQWHLNEAKRSYEAAGQAQDPATIVRDAEEAEQQAKKALKAAKGDVAEAQRIRQRASTPSSTYDTTRSYSSRDDGDELLAGAIGFVAGLAVNSDRDSNDRDTGGGFDLPSFGDGDSGGIGSSSDGGGDSGSW